MGFFDQPIGSRPSDPITGYTDWGAPIRRNALGTTYYDAPAPTPEAPAPREQLSTTLDGQGRAIHEYLPNESANRIAAATNTLGNILGGLTQGMTAPRNALMGEPVTYGDTWATALDWGLLSAPTPAPPGALRAGGARSAAPRTIPLSEMGPEDIRSRLETFRRGHPSLFRNADEWLDFQIAMAKPTPQMVNARQFAEDAIRRGEDVRFKVPEGPRGSLYVRVGDRGTIRFSDHAQPVEDGKTVGGFSEKLGRRHYAATMSVDPYGSTQLEDALMWLDQRPKGGLIGK